MEPSTMSSASRRFPRLWKGPIVVRGGKIRALTLTESLKPVDHRTTATELEDEELELREGPPYAASNIIWTGRKHTAITTEIARRELEESYIGEKEITHVGEGPADGRQALERQWESAVASTSGRSAVVQTSQKSRRARRRPKAKLLKTIDVNQQAPQAFMRQRRLPYKAILSLEKRREVLLELERCLEEALRSRAEPGRETAFDMFFGNLMYLPLLTHAEEGVLAHFVKSARKVQNKRKQLKDKLQRDPSKQEVADAAGVSVLDIDRILDEKKRAKSLLVQYNLRMVFSIAQQYIGNGEDLEDLLLEGISGLDLAAEKFDYKKGHKFSTYAYYWIRQAVVRCISNHSRVIRLPVHVCEALTKIKRITNELSGKGEVTDANIAEALGLPEDKVKLYKKVGARTRSLDTPLYTSYNKRMEQDATLLVDNVAQEDASVDDLLKDDMIKENLNVVLNTLHPRERDVLRMRYGLHRPGGGSMKLWDISSAYGLSPQRVRQIEEKAMHKLRRPWRKSLLLMP